MNTDDETARTWLPEGVVQAISDATNVTLQLDREILDLTDRWYRIVNIDHHKDRDCHWTISTTWSYGEEPKYNLWHAGYVYERVDETYDSLKDAKDALIEHLKGAIHEQVSYANRVLDVTNDEYDDYDDFDREDARKILRIAGV